MRNPETFIGKLRKRTGEEQVIEASSFTQYEPATSYQLGSTSMAVDLTQADWPNTGSGIVNTSRANDSFATQTFQPFGSSITYQRRWDKTPLAFSDPFDKANGITFNHDKWHTASYNTWTFDHYLYDGRQMLRGSNHNGSNGGLISNFYFPGDFSIYAKCYQVTSYASHSVGFQVGPKASVDGLTDPGTGANNNTVGIGSDGGGTYWMINNIKANQASATYWVRIRRVGTQIYLERKINFEDAWVQVATDTCPAALVGTGYVRIFGRGAPASTLRLDDFTIEGEGTSTVVIADPPSSARWSDWIEIKSAEESLEETRNAIDQAISDHNLDKHSNNITGSFTTTDGKTITVSNGIITSIA